MKRAGRTKARTSVTPFPSAAGDELGALIFSHIKERVGEVRKLLKASQRLSTPEGLHDFRVAFRRILACLDIADRMFAPSGTRRLTNSIKNLLKRLNDARAWDVFWTETRPTMRAAIDDQSAFALLEHPVGIARRDAHSAAKEAIETSSMRLLEALEQFAGREDWQTKASPEPGKRKWARGRRGHRKIVAKYLHRAWRRGKNFEELDSDSRHRLRLGLKKLKYVTEIFGLQNRSSTRKFWKRLTKLLEALGDANDRVVAAELMRSLAAKSFNSQEAFAAGMIAAGLRAGPAEEERASRRKWRRFRACRF